jgi:hypothetical protein
MLVATDAIVRDAAGDGGNVALHFDGFDPRDANAGRLMTQFYYRAAYALYPRRTFIGQDDRVVTGADTITAADTVPDVEWLKRHDVRSVVDVRPTGEIDVRPVR